MWALNKNSYYTYEQVQGYIGLLPNHFDMEDPRPLKDQCRESYNRMCNEISKRNGVKPVEAFYETLGVTITDDYLFQYPNDPDLPHVAVYARPGEQLVVYPYGLVAFLDLDSDGNRTGCLVVRMD